MVPWSMFMLILPWRSLMDVVRRRRVVTNEEWRLCIWALVPLLFFTISIGKQPRYILPVLPPVAILLARAITVRLKPDTTYDRKPLTVATVDDGRPLRRTCHASVAGTAAVHRRASSTLRGGSHRPPRSRVRVCRDRGHEALAPTSGNRRCVRAVLVLCVQFGALSGIRPEPVEEMAALVATHRTQDEPVGEYQAFVRNMVFYADSSRKSSTTKAGRSIS
jgi:hypothetical protein